MKFSAAAFAIVTASWQAVGGLAFAPVVPPAQPVQIIVPSSSVMVSQVQPASAIGIDQTMLKGLEKETKEAEKIAKIDERKAKAEKSREAFFEYEAKMAAEQESRIEAFEQKAIDEVIKDKKQLEKLMAEEQEIEKEVASNANLSAKEKAAKIKMEKKLLKQERDLLKREQAAEKKEKIYLAEEIQEQQILKRKSDLAKAEQQRFEAIEKEYERAAEIAKEDELELKLAMKMMPKNK